MNAGWPGQRINSGPRPTGNDPSAERANLATGEQLANIELAQVFTTALNAHDVDALVELFTEADSGPSVTADRYAWQKFEISLWAQQQVRMNIRMEAYDYRLTGQGVTWDADVYRHDWAALGVKVLPVTNALSSLAR